MDNMANKLMRADYDIKKILGDKKYFKKLYIYIRIRRLKKELYSLIDNSKFSSHDIINFCQLIYISKLLNLCELSTETITTSIITNTENRYPILGLIKVNIDNSYKIEIKAHIDSEIDVDGQIDISCLYPKNNIINNAFLEQNISYNYSTKIIDLDEVSNKQNISSLIINAYKILPDIFTIFIESILDSLKEKYLK